MRGSRRIAVIRLVLAASLAVLLVPVSAIPALASVATRHDHTVVGSITLQRHPVPQLISGPLSPAQVPVQSSARVVITPPRSSALRPASSLGTPLVYQGGSVLRTVKVYVDFWGTEWQSPNYTSAIAYIDGFFNDVGGSPWAQTMNQYCSGIATGASTCPGGANFIQSPASQLQGVWNDTNPAPASPTGGQISSEALSLAGHYGSPAGALYFVFTPQGKSESGFGNQFCAWHSWASLSVPFGYMPYQPDAGSNCGAFSVGSLLDGFGIVGGHEYAEAVTDPFPSTWPGVTGWVDQTSPGWQEIGDKCAWSPSPIDVSLSGHNYAVQSLFNNAAIGLPQAACVFAAPAPAVSSIAPSGGLMTGGTSVTIGGQYFNGVTAVKFGPTAATTFSVTNANQIAATSPPGTGTVDVTVTSSLGTNSLSAGDRFAYFSVPGPPTNLIATGGNAQATVVWAIPSSNGGSPISGYRVTVYVALVARASATLGVVTSVTLYGLTNGTAYTFSATALNAAGASVESSQSNSVTPATVPGQPTTVRRFLGADRLLSPWTAPGGGGSASPQPTVATETAAEPSTASLSALDRPAAIGLPTWLTSILSSFRILRA